MAVSSGAGKQGYPQLGAYSASKFGLMGLMQGLAGEVADDGIKVCTVVPGSILTPFGGRSVAEKREAMASDPGRKYLYPEDVADGDPLPAAAAPARLDAGAEPLAILRRRRRETPERADAAADRALDDGRRVCASFPASARPARRRTRRRSSTSRASPSPGAIWSRPRLGSRIATRRYVPDLPGYGYSEKPRRPLGIPELAEALAGYLDAFGVPRAVVLGNSTGCLVAAEFAYRYPERTERAILVSPPAVATTGPWHAACCNWRATDCGSRRRWRSSRFLTMSASVC